MDLPQSNTLTPRNSNTRTELLSLRTKTSLLSLSTVDRLKDLIIGYHLPRRHRSSRGVEVGPNGSYLFAEGQLPKLSTTKTSELSLLAKSPFLVAERLMPTMLRRLLLQCAGDIEINTGPDTTPTPTNCLRLMQWNANGISGKIIELRTFLHSNNINIAAIKETKLTNKTKPLKTPGWTAVRHDRHKNKGGGLLMLIKDTSASSTTRPLFLSQPILI